MSSSRVFLSFLLILWGETSAHVDGGCEPIKHLSASDWEALALSNNPKFQAIIARARRSYREKGGIRLEDLRRELGLPAKPKGAVQLTAPDGKSATARFD